MRYTNVENARRCRLHNEKLAELYVKCDTFDEFRIQALQHYNYHTYFFDPFWRAYYMRRQPVLYWTFVNIALAAISALVIWLLIVLTTTNFWLVVYPVLFVLLHMLLALVGEHTISTIRSMEH